MVNISTETSIVLCVFYDIFQRLKQQDASLQQFGVNILGIWSHGTTTNVNSELLFSYMNLEGGVHNTL